MAHLEKNLPAMWETWVQSLGWEDPWRRERLPTPVSGLENSRPYGPWGHKELDTTERLSLWGFPFGSAGKESACSVGDLDSIPGLERSPGEGKSYLLQYSGLENSIDCIIHRVAKSRT